MFVIGGGVNGCGIARDAAGRGLSVMLAEMGDLGSATSSASSKLLHGGLRYLEFLEFRLVREALKEREILLRAMPHISWPLRFVLPHHPDLRFEGRTPTARLLGAVMPWLRGRRPAWLIRLGLFLYDHLGKREILDGAAAVDLTAGPIGEALKDAFEYGFEYSDCWVDDARLVVLNARDAKARGAMVLPRTRVTGAIRCDGLWRIDLTDTRTRAVRQVWAKAMVNAAGPWVGQSIDGGTSSNPDASVRLVRGGHIVTRRLFDHDKAYILQGPDDRIIFAIPYEDDFTLIGTTDRDHSGPDAPPECSAEEQDYLCRFASRYFKRPVTPEDVVWTFSGMRPLFDDGADSATAATREYVLKLEADDGPPLLTVFGGKITTYRTLAEAALERLAPFFPDLPGPWTADAALPGGDFPHDGATALTAALRARYSFLSEPWACRLIRCYGTEAPEILGSASTRADLGRDFGATLTEAEAAWLIANEFAETAEDILWRRTKLGLRLSESEADALDAWIRDVR